jgi:electron transfer flavoprotein-quinone oxidoreductase
MEHFDAIVVGAGPAGAAAALTLVRGGLKVALLDRGEFPGAKNLFGGVLYRHQLDVLLPNAWKESGFPVERTITDQRYWLLGPESMVTVGHKHHAFADPPNAWTAFRARFDPWFAAKAEAAGAVPLYATTAVDVLVEPVPKKSSTRVVGIATDRPDGRLSANVVVIADGVNSLLREKVGAQRSQPRQLSLAVKEVLALPREKIEDRFNLEAGEGATIEFLGAPSQGMVGLGFLYTNKDTLSFGLGVMVDDLAAHQHAPYALLEQAKAHPMLRRLLAGASSVEYGAHLIPEGGWNAVPALAGDGWVLCGDAAGLVNVVNREGTPLAQVSGILAAETILEAHRRGDFSARSLSTYARRLRASFVGRDLRNTRRLPGMLHAWGGERLFDDMVGGLNEAAYRYFLVDGMPKREAQHDAVRRLVHAAGGWLPLARLGVSAWRGLHG